MTAKKTAKSAKVVSRSQPAKKSKSASGLLSRIKGALGKKPAAKAAKPASVSTTKSKPTTKKSVSKKSSAVAAVKKIATKASTARSKPKTAAKPSVQTPAKSQALTSKPAKPASPANKARPVPTPAAAVPRPVSTHHVTKSPAKKTRIASFSPNLTEDDIKAMHEDDYMNEVQLEFFRRRLMQMRQEVLQREMDVKERLHEREVFADPADRATAEEEHWLDLRLRERESLLLRKIDDALRRIEAKEYGYCEKTGDPIGIPRLLARPTATVCVDVKGQDERVEAQYRDR